MNESKQAQIDLESVILGSIIQNDSLLDSLFLEQKITDSMFELTANRTLYQVFLDMHFQNIKINEVSLYHYLSQNQIIDIVGGLEKITSLSKDYSGGNTEYYLSELKKMYQKRETYRILRDCQAKLPEVQTEPRDIIAELIEKLSALTDISNDTKYLNMSDLLHLLKVNTDEAMQNGNQVTGIYSGIDVFDKATDGFQKGELYILAARPSIGKTSMALSMCMNIASQHSVAFISLETPDRTIAEKCASLISEVPSFRIKKGFISDSQYSTIFQDTKKWTDRAFYLVDKPYIRIEEVKAVIRHLVLCNQVEIVFIDYIGLIEAGESANQPVYEKQSIVSKALKGMSREFNIPICALCQVSRASESEPPKLSDLRGSGSIEQDADVVMFIHGERHTVEDPAERLFYLEKNRNGECLKKTVLFNKKLSRYENKPEEK